MHESPSGCNLYLMIVPYLGGGGGSGQLLVDSFITSEESLMGIDETSTDDWREEILME